ncbi:unnamed protein product [Trichobilharzia regenti]|nr:unnamed protein product [Trichobilharzia regenti]
MMRASAADSTFMDDGSSEAGSLTMAAPQTSKRRRGRPPHGSSAGSNSRSSVHQSVSSKLAKKLQRLLDIVIEYKDK